MSLETDLSNAVSALNDTAEAYNGKIGDINARVDAAVASVPGVMGRNIYINAVTGDDANPGTMASPVQSISGAAGLMASGGFYEINLQTDVVLDERVAFRASGVAIVSDVFGETRNLYFANQVDGVSTKSPALALLTHGGALYFEYIALHSNVMAGHVTERIMINATGITDIRMWHCDFVLPAGADLAFLRKNHGFTLTVVSTTYPAEMAGLWMQNVAAGTDPASVPEIHHTTLGSL
ncbi:MAG: hypothetical protein QNJ16_19895 [Rhodobacter sp.]|nr:hypothetical protein [Rhodobacter sp.]